MSGYPELLLILVVVIAFFVGYALVSYLAKFYKKTGTNDGRTPDKPGPTESANPQTIRPDQLRDWRESEAKRRQTNWDSTDKKP